MPVSKEIIKVQLDKIGSFCSLFVRYFLVDNELSKLHNVINEDETIVYLTTGYIGGMGLGLVVATDKRLIQLHSTVLFSSQKILPYDSITSIHGECGLFFGGLCISTAGYSGSVYISFVRKCNVNRMISVVSKYMSEAKKDKA